ncbi:MAG: tetratricopeptide repeat protein [Thermomicrobiales bacterium]
MVDFISRVLRNRRGIEGTPVYRLAVAVTTGHMSWRDALAEARAPRVIADIADGDLIELDRMAQLKAQQNLDFGLILARLTVAAARAKGFEKVYVDLSLNLAEMLQRAGLDEERDYYLRQALQSARRVSYQSGYRSVLNRMARYASMEHNDQDARQYLADQLTVGREESDTPEDVETAILLADMALRDGQRTVAHDLFQRAARSARRLGLYSLVVEALLRQVAIVLENGDSEGALRILRQAEEVSDRTVDARLRARVAERHGGLQLEAGEFFPAVTNFELALRFARQDEDLALQARSLRGLARGRIQLGEVEVATELLRELVDLELSIGNIAESGQAQLELAELLIDARELDEALRSLAQAREAATTMRDPQMSVRVHGLLGTLMVVRGEADAALEAFEVAVSTSRQIEDAASEVYWLLGAAEAVLRFRRSGDARNMIDRAARLSRSLDNPMYQAQVAGLKGQVALVEGRAQEAARAFGEATDIALDHGRTGIATHYLPILARLALDREEADRAVEHMVQALDLAKELGDSRQLCLLNLQTGRIYRQIDDPERAIPYFRDATKLSDDAGDLRLRYRALLGLAECLDDSGDYDQAAEYYRRALDVSRQLGNDRAVARLHFNLGALLVDIQRDDEARAHLARAQNIAEDLQEIGLADRAAALLASIAPPGFPLEEYQDDMPLNEAPAPPRNFENEPN